MTRGHSDTHDGHAPTGADPGPGHGGRGGHGAHGEASDTQAHAAHGGHGDHGGHGGHGDHAQVFRRLFWWNLLLAVPVLVFSSQIQDWFGYSLDFALVDWVPPILGSIIYWWGGWPFLSGGWDEARRRQPGMMLLIAVAITVAYVSSLASSIEWGDLDFWWELAALIVVMLLGHWLEMKAIGQAQGALSALAALLPDEAERVRDGSSETVSLADLAVGDLVLVRPGGRVPADGVVVGGAAELDESMITGESKPVPRAEGDTVVAGTVSTDSSIRVRVEALGEDTALAGIRRMVETAQSSRSRAQALADRAAAALFYLAAAAAVVTMLAWASVGDPAEGVIRTVTVLVIACPHALGLAIPLVISISTAISARAGILVKDRLALEQMRTIDAVLFDKTGTLTLGRHAVVDHVAIGGRDRGEVLAMAAAAESDSEHPMARAVVSAAAAAGLDVPAATDFEAMTGRGVRSEVGGTAVAVGGPALIEQLGLSEPPELAERTAHWRSQGGAVLYVIADGEVIGALTMADEIRPESRQTVDELHARGKRVVLVTGDARQVADTVAAELGIDEVFAEVLPGDKDAKVAELQQRGLSVAMVGDGVNDAPALARADVGIAIGAGTDVAIESAGVVLASDDPRGVIGVIDLSTASYRKMVENLVWATGYNLLAIPVAAGVFAFAGVTISPAIAAIAMSASTIIVAANAQLLRRVDLRRGEPEPAPSAAVPAAV